MGGVVTMVNVHSKTSSMFHGIHMSHKRDQCIDSHSTYRTSVTRSAGSVIVCGPKRP